MTSPLRTAVPTRRRAVAGLPVVVLAAVALAGCGGDLRADDTVRFLRPGDGARVELPAAIRWSVDRDRFRPGKPGARVRDGRGVFGVFVDREPVRVGRSVQSVAARDTSCRPADGCPDRDYLASRGIHLTQRTGIAFDHLPDAPDGRRDGDYRRHVVTVVLLDGRGVRVSDQAWRHVLYAKPAPTAEGSAR